jgi:lipoprotein-anchoring transpeptidase ErfK/SrfK
MQSKWHGSGVFLDKSRYSGTMLRVINKERVKRRNTKMQKLHQKLMEKNGKYAAWHKFAPHAAVHWFLFGIVAIACSMVFVLGANGSILTSLFEAPTVASTPVVHAVQTQATTLHQFPMKTEDVVVSAVATKPAAAPETPKVLAAQSGPASPCKTGKCILVLLNKQRVYAFQDGKQVYTSLVSTGVAGHRTPTGTFHIYGKTVSQKMSGPGYYLPHVPYILWFKGDYSLHGTYWHHNFGHVMSHGCVNLPTPVAHWFFDWAQVGTAVVIRAS